MEDNTNTSSTLKIQYEGGAINLLLQQPGGSSVGIEKIPD
jgi:hypothetical protein